MATAKKNRLSHEAYLEHMKKTLPEGEKVLSGAYNMQNPKWMGKKLMGTPAKQGPRKKSVTLFGL